MYLKPILSFISRAFLLLHLRKSTPVDFAPNLANDNVSCRNDIADEEWFSFTSPISSNSKFIQRSFYLQWILRLRKSEFMNWSSFIQSFLLFSKYFPALFKYKKIWSIKHIFSVFISPAFLISVQYRSFNRPHRIKQTLFCSAKFTFWSSSLSLFILFS